MKLNRIVVVTVSMLLSSAVSAQVGGSGLASGSGASGSQSAPWQNQAQALQRQLSPATGDMALSGASTQSQGGGYGLSSGGSGSVGGRLSGSMHGLGGGAGGQPWMNQAQQLQRKLNGSGGVAGSGDLGGSSSLSSGADLGAAAPNPYAGMQAVPGVGGAVPGASSPYTSTGNAAGNTPYRDPYGLNQLETAGTK